LFVSDTNTMVLFVMSGAHQHWSSFTFIVERFIFVFQGRKKSNGFKTILVLANENIIFGLTIYLR